MSREWVSRLIMAKAVLSVKPNPEARALAKGQLREVES